LHLKIYFDEKDIKSIFDKIVLLRFQKKNYHKLKLEYFIVTLFQANLKNVPRFLIDFFIRNESSLNNCMEIFSKDFKKVNKKFDDLSFKLKKSNSHIENEIGNQIKKENEKPNIQSGHEKINSFVDFKKFFELNFKKNLFTIDETNQTIKAKIFTKFLKAILRSKKLTQIYKLLNLDFYYHSNEIDDFSPTKIEKGNF